MDVQGIKVSDSSIRRALKIRKYAYKKPNIETMILNALKRKREEITPKLHWLRLFKMIFIDESVLKEENKEAESGDQMKKITEYHY